MNPLKKILSINSLTSWSLTGIGIIAYYMIEFASSFFISTIDLVEIGSAFWKIIYACFGVAACSLVLYILVTKIIEKESL